MEKKKTYCKDEMSFASPLPDEVFEGAKYVGVERYVTMCLGYSNFYSQTFLWGENFPR